MDYGRNMLLGRCMVRVKGLVVDISVHILLSEISIS